MPEDCQTLKAWNHTAVQWVHLYLDALSSFSCANGLKFDLFRFPKAFPREAYLLIHVRQVVQSSPEMCPLITQVVELPPVACLPSFIVQRYLHRPQRVHVGGTMLVS